MDMASQGKKKKKKRKSNTAEQTGVKKQLTEHAAAAAKADKAASKQGKRNRQTREATDFPAEEGVRDCNMDGSAGDGDAAVISSGYEQDHHSPAAAAHNSDLDASEDTQVVKVGAQNCCQMLQQSKSPAALQKCAPLPNSVLMYHMQTIVAWWL